MRDCKGFTLVELAIVLVIIGLLITGLLKGAELISSARVKSTIQQIRALDAATTTFRDSYRFLPGDILNAVGRLPNCGTLCNNTPNPLNGNGRIDELNISAALLPSTENTAYFQHLAVADLITGVNIDNAATNQFGDGLLETPFGVSGYGVGYHAGGNLLNQTIGATQAKAGHYIVSHGSPNVQTGETPRLKALNVQHLDLKLDDGLPGTGILRGVNNAACGTAVGLYNTVAANGVCDFYAKIQN